MYTWGDGRERASERARDGDKERFQGPASDSGFGAERRRLRSGYSALYCVSVNVAEFVKRRQSQSRDEASQMK